MTTMKFRVLELENQIELSHRDEEGMRNWVLNSKLYNVGLLQLTLLNRVLCSNYITIL